MGDTLSDKILSKEESVNVYADMITASDVYAFISKLRDAQQESDDPDVTLVAMVGEKLI